MQQVGLFLQNNGKLRNGEIMLGNCYTPFNACKSPRGRRFTDMSPKVVYYLDGFDDYKSKT